MSVKYRILHISDLHFGKLQIDVWNYLFERMTACKPDIIAISGDIIDCPIFRYRKFKEARKKIIDLAEKCDAEVVLVPGNHDVGIFGCFNLGFLTNWGFKKWFKRIKHGESVITTSIYDNQILDIVEKYKILFAPFDSTKKSFISSGKVKEKEIDELDNLLFRAQAKESIYGQRISIVHHHPLPVPYSEGDHWREPFLVFKNAGNFISELYKHDFDIVLHGHKHHTNFCKIDYEKRETRRKELAILAAGSTIKKPKSYERNNYNLIFIHDNGEVVIEQFFFGGGRIPESISFPLYRDPNMRKEAIYLKSLELQGFECEESDKIISIDKVGSATVNIKCKGLKKSKQDFEKSYRPFNVTLSSGRLLYCRLDQSSQRENYALEINENESDGKKKRGIIRLTDVPISEPVSEPGINYGWEFRAHNAYAMNKQEYERFKKDKKYEEWTGSEITFPCKKFKIKIEFPKNLAKFLEKEKPRLYIYYNQKLMHADRDPQGELIYSPVDEEEWQFDRRMTAFEKGNFGQTGAHKWELNIENPLVGYRYEIKWNLPDEFEFFEEKERNKLLRIKHNVKYYQKILLSYRNNKIKNISKSTLNAIKEVFKFLHNSLEKTYKSTDTELFSTSIMTYDEDKDLLGIVEGYKTVNGEIEELELDLELEPGLGNAGFSYKLGKPVFYNEELIDEDNKYYIPSETGVDYKVLLSIPLYLSAIEEFISAYELEAHSVIHTFGVLNVGSTSSTSKLKLIEKQDIQSINDLGNEVLSSVLKELTKT